MATAHVETIVIALTFLALITTRDHADRIREAIDNFRNNFRGGPPTPSPSNDAALLTRRLKRRPDL